MRSIVIALLLAPALAHAQPTPGTDLDDPPGTPKPTPTATSEPAAPTREVPAWYARRHGVTFEAGVGMAAFDSGREDGALDNSTGIGGSVGLGAWLTPRIALTARVLGTAELKIKHPDASYSTYIGPSVQLWLTEHGWFAGGLGLGRFRPGEALMGERDNALATDLRAGYTWTRGRASTFYACLEVMIGLYEGGAGTAWTFGIGFQYL